MDVCLYFVGNLSSFFGSRICLSIDSCPPIREVVSYLIRKYDVPLTTEHVVYLSDSGTSLSGEESICKFAKVYVVRALQGG